MNIHSFSELSEEQKRNIYQFANSFEYKSSFGSYEEMSRLFEGIIFDYGKSLFSLWEEGRLLGTLGAISKEAAARGEIFITAINIKEHDIIMLEPLLTKAFDYCSDFKAARFRLGVMYDRFYLIPEVEKCGFKEADRNLVMKYTGNAVKLQEDAEKCFNPLSPESIKDYQRVESAAFLQAPNGGAVEDDDLQDLLEEYRESDLAGVLYVNGIAAGTYTLRIKEDTGWIESIGVAPDFQGKGIGRLLLLKSVEVLQGKEVPEIKLSVFSSNSRAVQLYLKSGFKVESEQSIWYERKKEG